MTDPQDIDQIVDARGLECPLPILRTKLAIAQMSPGQHLLAKCTDPHASLDFQVFCERCGHDLLSESQHGEELHFLLRVGQAATR